MGVSMLVRTRQLCESHNELLQVFCAVVFVCRSKKIYYKLLYHLGSDGITATITLMYSSNVGYRYCA
jgi:hypothetical protein